MSSQATKVPAGTNPGIIQRDGLALSNGLHLAGTRALEIGLLARWLHADEPHLIQEALTPDSDTHGSDTHGISGAPGIHHRDCGSAGVGSRASALGWVHSGQVLAPCCHPSQGAFHAWVQANLPSARVCAALLHVLDPRRMWSPGVWRDDMLEWAKLRSEVGAGKLNPHAQVLCAEMGSMLRAVARELGEESVYLRSGGVLRAEVLAPRPGTARLLVLPRDIRESESGALSLLGDDHGDVPGHQVRLLPDEWWRHWAIPHAYESAEVPTGTPPEVLNLAVELWSDEVHASRVNGWAVLVPGALSEAFTSAELACGRPGRAGQPSGGALTPTEVGSGPASI